MEELRGECEKQSKKYFTSDGEFKKLIDKSSTSSYDSPENFDWVSHGGNKDKMTQFMKFPIYLWKRLISDGDELNRKIRPRTGYQDIVNTILKYDVFKDTNFKAETMKYRAMNDESINPDFFISDIESTKFNKIMEERSYMFKIKYPISKNIKRINVIGEVKSSKNRFKMKRSKE